MSPEFLAATTLRLPWQGVPLLNPTATPPHAVLVQLIGDLFWSTQRPLRERLAESACTCAPTAAIGHSSGIVGLPESHANSAASRRALAPDHSGCARSRRATDTLADNQRVGARYAEQQPRKSYVFKADVVATLCAISPVTIAGNLRRPFSPQPARTAWSELARANVCCQATYPNHLLLLPTSDTLREVARRFLNA